MCARTAEERLQGVWGDSGMRTWTGEEVLPGVQWVGNMPARTTGGYLRGVRRVFDMRTWEEQVQVQGLQGRALTTGPTHEQAPLVIRKCNTK